MKGNLSDFAFATGAVVVGVLLAGYVMSVGRKSVNFLSIAHAGYDS